MLIEFHVLIDVPRSDAAVEAGRRFVAELVAMKGRTYDASVLVVRGRGARESLEADPRG